MLHPAIETHPGEDSPGFLLNVEPVDPVQRCKTAHVKNAPSVRRGSIYEINDRLDGLAPPWDVDEGMIRRILARVERCRERHARVYWLTMARLAELSLNLAGAYADGCEFSAAGDLLVNPSKTLIHVKGCGRPIVKRRWGALSDQLNPSGENRGAFIRWVKKNVVVETVEKPLIPDLFERLDCSGMMAPWYLNDFKGRMEKTGDVIGFLAAWKVRDAVDLAVRMQTASPGTRKFVAASLCNFDNAHFNRLGLEIRTIENGPGDGERLLPRYSE